MSTTSDEFLSLIHGRVVVLGIGNITKGDDAAGIYLLELLRGKIAAYLIDGGVAPENSLEKIVSLNPERLIILDAMEFGSPPGGMRLFSPDDLEAGGLSTHSLSPDILIEYITNRLPSVRVHILGIQPRQCQLGASLSPDVLKSLESFARKIGRTA